MPGTRGLEHVCSLCALTERRSETQEDSARLAAEHNLPSLSLKENLEFRHGVKEHKGHMTVEPFLDPEMTVRHETQHRFDSHTAARASLP